MPDKPISSRELIIRAGGDPDAPFERGPFPPEMRMFPARDGIEAQRGLNDVFPGDPYPMPDTPTPTEAMRERADEIVREVTRQNWKLGGALAMDLDEGSNLIAQALAETDATARREGAEDMRERAALYCEAIAENLRTWHGDDVGDVLIKRAANAIRSLPVEQEGR